MRSIVRKISGKKKHMFKHSFRKVYVPPWRHIGGRFGIIKRRLKKLALILAFIFIGFVCTNWCNFVISASSYTKLYNSIKKLPRNKVGLVLGTSRTLSDGRENLYFKHRIEAAAELFKHKKVKYLIASGERRADGYDEPGDMKKALIKKGIPAKNIFLDTAGYSTLDSIIRAKKVFGQTRFTIISQEFHNNRAVYIAEFHGIDAIAYNAEDVNGGVAHIKVMAREYLAKVSTIMDLYILHREPKKLDTEMLVSSL